MESIDCVVVGAGVVGLAVARALAESGREVVVVERETAIGTHTSSRNSEVIHAGIYYPQGSLKARSCVEGRNLLYDYCRAHGVPYRQSGKLIVAADAGELDALKDIQARGRRNGVEDLALLTAAEAMAMEPALTCVGALLSPSTGIVDSHALMLAYRGDAEAAGAMIAFGCPLLDASADAEGFTLRLGGEEPYAMRARCLVNSAGLFAPDVAGAIEGLDRRFVPRPYFARGTYFVLGGPSPFSRLIYPVPVPGGLGTHLTLDLGGQARFGPDVEWIAGIDYSVDPGRLDAFIDAIRRYWPDVDPARLQPGYSGIRPKIAPADAPASDFILQDSAVHGVKGLINLFGIESPGLTASLYLGDQVRAAAGRDLA